MNKQVVVLALQRLGIQGVQRFYMSMRDSA
jgi:hypothetical protein